MKMERHGMSLATPHGSMGDRPVQAGSHLQEGSGLIIDPSLCSLQDAALFLALTKATSLLLVAWQQALLYSSWCAGDEGPITFPQA